MVEAQVFACNDWAFLLECTDAVFSQNYSSQFWLRWLVVGALAGALAGAIVTLLLLVLSQSIDVTTLSSKLIPSMAIMGGVYGIGQGIAQFLSLRAQIPQRRYSLRTNFIGTAVGSIITGVLLVGLLAIGFADLLNSLGFSSALVLIVAVFIVGGFGGIAQAIVERFLLRTTVQGSYFRWIAPLALLGHVSGGLAGIAITPFL